MSYAGKHPNIVELVGVQFDKGGKGYLAPTEIETVKPFDTHTLLLWTKQVCSAMTFLSAKQIKINSGSYVQIIHGDLAARNVLVDEHFVAKISDFGLSRQIYDQYKKYVFAKKETQLPWRWLAIETLKHSKFSSESDIWAFGVFMWEMFSLGDTPYTAGSQWGPEFVSFLDQGLRLEAPEYARQEMYENIYLKFVIALY
ncbi:tyrosine-protein kinase receptor Tie-1 [Folsomia candida]|uniref:tyrosine-protein kinase receptor Tie-1 n=1 Tax=Folsomia candida TaxID=158441 RepID=UPI0016055259|nr:tyrosine-protein kinase receptor Tie-1 [Folsomia candida]